MLRELVSQRHRRVVGTTSRVHLIQEPLHLPQKRCPFPLTICISFQLFELSFGPGTVLVPFTIGLGVAGGHLDSQLRA